MIRQLTPRRRRLRTVAFISLLALAGSLIAAFSVSDAHRKSAAAQPATRIRDIQGAAHLSPLNGAAVSGVRGIVTARRANGFFMQDATPDNDPRTSEGIFVLAPSASNVAVGDSLDVNGTVTEARQGANAETNANLSVTQINASSVAVVASGNALPAPVRIGAGGRRPPTDIFEDDARGNVESGGAFDPASDGLDFYESLEGMRVQVRDALAVGHSITFRSGAREIPVLGDGGRHAGLRTTRGGIVVRPDDFNPERLHLSGELNALPDLDVGDGFRGTLDGVLDYSFGNYKLIVTRAPPPVARGGLRRETATAAGSNQLAVASFNVQNLDPSDSAQKFRQLAEIIVGNLKSPDLVAIEEIQDNNGATNDAVVDASETFARLISTIRAAGGPAYSFRHINPVDDQDGGEPGGNIRVGFLFRTDRGLKFTERAGGGPTTPTSVSNEANVPRLSSSPGRLAPTDPAFGQTRKPLAGEFTFNGHRLFVIANHLSSKGGDHPLFGRFQPPVRQSETKRHRQAQIVNEFVNSILAVDRNANVIVLGDLNDFEFSVTLQKLTGNVLRNLFETLPPRERYTYIFEGNAQALDHILVTRALFASLVKFDVV
ncbi:MAG TPA: endonuclease/exonuclease/phosphatase family protein, partial [Pyrinomonadaceae bacterium]